MIRPYLTLVFAFALSLASCAPAFADTGPFASAIDGTLASILSQTIQSLVIVGLLAVLTALGVFAPKAWAWAKAHAVIKDHAVATAVLQRALGIVEPFVLKATQTAVDAAKADLSAGKLDKETYEKTLIDIKQGVVNDAMTAIHQQGLTAGLGDVLGAGAFPAADIRTFVSTSIEALLAQHKAAAVVSPAVVVHVDSSAVKTQAQVPFLTGMIVATSTTAPDGAQTSLGSQS